MIHQHILKHDKFFSLLSQVQLIIQILFHTDSLKT